MSFNDKGERICDNCGKVMHEGYVVNGNSYAEHYCSEECLYKHYSREEYEEMYDDGDGDSYWTEWYDE